MRVVFFGTPEFAATILQALVVAKIDIAAVVTKPDKPQGRSLKLQPPAVKILVAKLLAAKLLPNIPVLQPIKCSTIENIEILKAFNADLFVVVAYGEILSQAILDIPKSGCINVHASLLPRYRGAAPIQRCLMNGDTETGISIIRMVKKMDAGDILHVEKSPIPLEMNFEELEKTLCILGTKALLKVISDIEQGTIVETVQDPEKVTFAEKITQEECRIDWRRPAIEVYNLIRGLSPHPGAWCEILLRGQKKRLKVLRAEICAHSPEVNKKDLIVTCGSGALTLLQLQLEGKPKMAAQDFLKGFPLSEIRFL